MEWRRELKIEEGFSSWLLGPDHVWNLLWTPGGVQSAAKWSNKEINGKVERNWGSGGEKEKADRTRPLTFYSNILCEAFGMNRCFVMIVLCRYKNITFDAVAHHI